MSPGREKLSGVPVLKAIITDLRTASWDQALKAGTQSPELPLALLRFFSVASGQKEEQRQNTDVRTCSRRGKGLDRCK